MTGFPGYFPSGGHVAYGTRDKQWKYGVHGRLYMAPRLDMELGGSYLDDVRESGGYSFFITERGFGTEAFRRFMVEQKDEVVGWKTWYNFRTLQYFRISLSFENTHIGFTEGYLFRVTDSPTYVYINNTTVSEAALRLRFAFKEKFLESFQRRISLGTTYPIIYFNYLQGLDVLDGQLEYRKYELRLDKSFISKNFGRTRFVIDAGLVSGRVPYSLLYVGRGSYRPFTIDSCSLYFGSRIPGVSEYTI